MQIYLHIYIYIVYVLMQKEMEPNCSSYDRISDVSSSSISETSPKKPNLEFTLGRPQWKTDNLSVFLVLLIIYIYIFNKIFKSFNFSDGSWWKGIKNQFREKLDGEKRKVEGKKGEKKELKRDKKTRKTESKQKELREDIKSYAFAVKRYGNLNLNIIIYIIFLGKYIKI